MTSAKTFPVLLSYWERKDFPDCPRNIPWEMIEPARVQAHHNHSQTLERLAERGGLHPTELWCAWKGIPLREGEFNKDGLVKAVDFLMSKLRDSSGQRLEIP